MPQTSYNGEPAKAKLKLCKVPDTDQIASVSWSQKAGSIVVGNTMREIDVFDTQRK